MSSSGPRIIAAALGALALVTATMPAAALAEKSVPRVIHVHPTDVRDEYQPAGPKLQIVIPHVHHEPPRLPEIVDPPAATLPLTPAKPPATPKSIGMTRFDVTSENPDLHNPGPTGCDLACQRAGYQSAGAALANVGRNGDVDDWVVAMLAAQLKEAGEKVNSLQNATPGQGAPQLNFVDDLMELWESSGERVKKVLAPIIVTELISGLFGTTPACGVEKLPSGQPTCVK